MILEESETWTMLRDRKKMEALKCGAKEVADQRTPYRGTVYSRRIQFKDGMSDLTPVSYTHLDVYKRQLQYH